MSRPRERKVGRRGMGWLWPAQPCGLPYDKFRSGLTFKDAYEWLAYRQNEQGQSFRPSQRRIVGAMAKLKREMFSQYEKGCEVERGGGKPSKTWADCKRVCKTKSKPCGKSCVSKKRNCKKLPPAAGVCSINDFQENLSFDQAAAQHWEEQRAAGAAMPDEGDTSFDFVVEPAAPAPTFDDDFGYEAPTKYGFTGLRGALAAGGRGGAAANRGKYKPLPAGQGAVDQVRALERARAQIIAAVESGRFELCERGVARPTSPAPMTVSQQQTHGSRTQGEIDAIRRRFERAGY